MSSIRPLEEQFEKETVVQIRDIQSALQRYPISGGAGLLYAREIDSALESGLLLASLELASTLVEIIVRDLFIHHLVDEFNIEDLSDSEAINVIEIGIEDSKDINFSSFRGIITQLNERSVISDALYGDLSIFYSNIRIPLLHGLSRRFLRGKRVDPISAASDPSLDELLFLARQRRTLTLDRHIEEKALEILQEIIRLIEECSRQLSA